ncbi:hypothetical protein [Nocardiopsis tropica]|uniref:Uncharacterized protein n=1 Tax=Nocardiopsis tropica TaxID=109330 RepID=A0ABU7KRU3_9ACTN|nr:hypothetical protein [Nocardiopsis umidischolae]MEE2051719.1 hypothetical protein [Nocardiopsis umidischolae]
MDTLDRLTAALHAELCRLHDVTPEGWSLTGDYAALRDDAERLAEVAVKVMEETGK